jgi:hypothetical protein
MPRTAARRDSFSQHLESRFRHLDGCDPSNTEAYWRSIYPDCNWVCSSASAMAIGYTYDRLYEVIWNNPQIFHCHKAALIGDSANVLTWLLISDIASITAGIQCYQARVRDGQRMRALKIEFRRV